jgi:signal transduction histidine kinase
MAQRSYLTPKTGKSHIILDQGWVYVNDDKPGYRLKHFDDLSWKPIDPASAISDPRFNDVKHGVSWMRLRFQLTGQPKDGTISLMFHQSVASEIYLNGKLLKVYGRLGDSVGKTKAFDPRWAPVIVRLDTTAEQVLAVRFATEKGIRPADYFGAKNPLFEVRVMEPESASVKYAETYQRTWIDLLNAGILLAICILHLAFFLMYREQKANLYFSMAAFLNLLGVFCHIYFYHIAQPGNKFLFANMTLFLYLCSSFLILISIYEFLQLQKGLFFYSWLVIGILSFTATFFWPIPGFGASVVTGSILIYIVVLIAAGKAIRTNSMGAYAIMTGALMSLAAFCLFLVAIAGNTDEILWVDPVNPATFITLVRSLSLPAALSIFLARDFAVTSRSLAAKLRQVEELSAEKLQAEQEKQDLLTSRNAWLEQRVTERTQELEQSFQNLKAAQAQLIQSEKMASLGELTAGIAHEIQNPLNFVNNFSDLNQELIEELKEELNRNDVKEAASIADNLRENEAKINLHGRRADGIVKSMLQHSRSSGGQKEPTDINKLVDEYTRLAYHGFRARHKDFTVKLDIDLDQHLPLLPVVAQDIGRVLLNLLNNAFQAVDEKTRAAGDGYQPTVTVSTKRSPRGVDIRVEDNGPGIPDKIKDKIFQPFFTTRPTGQGTGLGLSLSYDIVNVHGGAMNVDTREGEGSAFVIQLRTNLET